MCECVRCCALNISYFTLNSHTIKSPIRIAVLCKSHSYSRRYEATKSAQKINYKDTSEFVYLYMYKQPFSLKADMHFTYSLCVTHTLCLHCWAPFSLFTVSWLVSFQYNTILYMEWMKYIWNKMFHLLARMLRSGL